MKVGASISARSERSDRAGSRPRRPAVGVELVIRMGVEIQAEAFEDWSHMVGGGAEVARLDEFDLPVVGTEDRAHHRRAWAIGGTAREELPIGFDKEAGPAVVTFEGRRVAADQAVRRSRFYEETAVASGQFSPEDSPDYPMVLAVFGGHAAASIPRGAAVAQTRPARNFRP